MVQNGRTLVILLGCVALLGCYRSTLVVRSEPSGGEAYLDGAPIGQTPLEHQFLWYGEHYVKVEKPGYATKSQKVFLTNPPYAVIPLDLFLTILPVPITDRHYANVFLEPAGEAGSATEEAAGIIAPATVEAATP